MTVVRNLVELHGGRIQARSEGLGTGSEFLVTLPLASPGELPAGAAPAEPTGAGASPGRRVLVVDDNGDAAQTLALLLQSGGHVVMVASDGPSALARAEEHPPDVVLLDLGLPGMDGYQVARHLRANPRTRAARIAAMTGYGQPGDRARTLAAGFDDHLVKPVAMEDLATFVNATPAEQAGGLA